jgi:hypothetical protein
VWEGTAAAEDARDAAVFVAENPIEDAATTWASTMA